MMGGIQGRTIMILAGVLVTTAWLAGAGARPARAAFPGTNGPLTFVSGGQVRTIDPATGQVTDIVAGFTPAWSPDGSRLAVSAMGGLGLDIVVVGADGSSPVNLTEESDVLAIEPAWSPAGDAIVHADASTAALVVMGADGSDKRRHDLSASLRSASRPRWSPDGSRIVFVGSYQDGEGTYAYDLFSIGPDGSGLAQLTHSKVDGRAGDYAPDWSPDGSRLVWEARFDAPMVSAIWVMDADGTDARPLVEEPLPAGFPNWSPDGTSIAYTVGDRTIRVVGSDGSGATDVLAAEDPVFVAGWRPLPAP